MSGNFITFVSSGTEEGEVLQIIEINQSTGKPECVLENIERVFLDENTLHTKLAIVSVNGAFRKGKSFLLNICLTYLKNQPFTEWDETVLTGFKSNKGTQTITKGLQVWSKPIRTKDINGEDINLFLVDTEGLFDTSAYSGEDLAIFALSALISSVQIHFFDSPLNSNEIDCFQFFVNFANRFSLDASYSPFQKMILLFRDWINPEEYEYGYEGGRKYLAEFEGNRCQRLDNLLSTAFETECFLMPHPGEHVAWKNFNQQIRSISPDYLKEVKVLANSILASGNVEQKIFVGQPLDGEMIVEHLKTIVAWIKSSDQLDASSLFASIAKNRAELALDELKGKYLVAINKFFEEAEKVTQDSLLRFHRSLMHSCIREFNDQTEPYNSQQSIVSYRSLLTQELTNLYEDLENERKHLEEDNITNRSSKLTRFYELKEVLKIDFSQWQTHRQVLIGKLSLASGEMRNLEEQAKGRELGLNTMNFAFKMVGTVTALLTAGPLLLVGGTAALGLMALMAGSGLVNMKYKDNKASKMENVIDLIMKDTELLKEVESSLSKMRELVGRIQDLKEEKCASITILDESLVCSYLEILEETEELETYIELNERIRDPVQQNFDGICTVVDNEETVEMVKATQDVTNEVKVELKSQEAFAPLKKDYLEGKKVSAKHKINPKNSLKATSKESSSLQLARHVRHQNRKAARKAETKARPQKEATYAKIAITTMNHIYDFNLTGKNIYELTQEQNTAIISFLEETKKRFENELKDLRERVQKII